ncbi:hypothetical protein PMM47T1_25788 [Pseudomonas sp. M47T1]|nr:hypothetical protein PMM47T1_25788 [Pseudomonas sp. M47T1]
MWAQAADIPLGTHVEADEAVAKVVSVDAAHHQVVLQGKDGQPVPIQLSDQAKDLGHLKPGDQVHMLVTHSVAEVLDTSVGGEPGATSQGGVVRATAANPNPGGAAFRQVQVRLKIIRVDLAKNQVVFEGPVGRDKVINVERPEIRARLKDLKVGQTVLVTYTDTLKVTTEHKG